MPYRFPNGVVWFSISIVSSNTILAISIICGSLVCYKIYPPAIWLGYSIYNLIWFQKIVRYG